MRGPRPVRRSPQPLSRTLRSRPHGRREGRQEGGFRLGKAAMPSPCRGRGRCKSPPSPRPHRGQWLRRRRSSPQALPRWRSRRRPSLRPPPMPRALVATAPVPPPPPAAMRARAACGGTCHHRLGGRRRRREEGRRFRPARPHRRSDRDREIHRRPARQEARRMADPARREELCRLQSLRRVRCEQSLVAERRAAAQAGGRRTVGGAA